LLDPVKEPFDQVAGSVEIRAEADRIVAIAFRWDADINWHAKSADSRE